MAMDIEDDRGGDDDVDAVAMLEGPFSSSSSSSDGESVSNSVLETTYGDVLWDHLKMTWYASPVLHLSESEFVEYAMEPTRPYYLAVLFTANTTGCPAAAEEFSLVARAYWINLERKRAVTSSNLFFIHMELASNQGVFRSHKITKVPVLVLIPPLDAEIQQDAPFPSSWIREHNDPLRFGAWISVRSKAEVPPPEILAPSVIEGFFCFAPEGST